MIWENPFRDNCVGLAKAHLERSTEVKEAAQWQSIDVSDRPEMVPWELLNVTVTLSVMADMHSLQDYVKPNLPWAEDHFQERISGEPLNPPPSHEWWPFRRDDNNEFRDDGLFSHTYPERFWPKHAQRKLDHTGKLAINQGIRFNYGDLDDVIALLRRDPGTRQAYLPVWFPEDTGSVEGQRVPCTLGYHFIIRQGSLHCVYYIRSCDFLRHFRDDVYMAARLMQVISGRVNFECYPGILTMHITSFHTFAGDKPILRNYKGR